MHAFNPKCILVQSANNYHPILDKKTLVDIMTLAMRQVLTNTHSLLNIIFIIFVY